MLTSILILGFLIGMQHAFEADHLAAISVLVSRRQGLGPMTRHGAIWGLGHTVALLAISGVVLLSSWTLPAGFEPALELVVGVVLVTLGGHLLFRLWRDRVHIHVHRHANGELHLHAHSHRHDNVPHSESPHQHEHADRGWRTLLVGVTHGAAGSAALIIYVATRLDSPSAGLVYVLVFGLGSMLGMALLTAVIALPLTATAKRLTWANRGLQIAVGMASIGIGLRLAVEQGTELWF